jgi:hypothetical protein
MKRPSRRRTAGKAGAAQDVAILEDIPTSVQPLLLIFGGWA